MRWLLLFMLAGCSGLATEDPSTYHVLDHTWPQWVCDVAHPTWNYCP